MLTLNRDAREYALNQGGSLYLEFIVMKSGCCIPYQPEPAVRVGKPYNLDHYRKEDIDGVAVFIPLDLPETPLAITLNVFMGFRKLVVEGWRHA